MNEDQLSQIVFQSHCHVLAIAVEDYAGLQYEGRDIAKLTKPRADAEAFFKVLKEKYDGFSDGNWKLLAGKEANKANIKANLDAIKAKAQPDDQVLVYYAGHGVLDGEDWYMLLYPADTELETTRAAEAEAYSFVEFFSKIKALDKPRATLLVLDGCHANAVFQNINTGSTKTPVFALTAALSTQVSFEQHPAHTGFNSPFAENLIALLRDGDGERPYLAKKLGTNLHATINREDKLQTVNCDLIGRPAIVGNLLDTPEFEFRPLGPACPPMGEVKKLFLKHLFSTERGILKKGPPASFAPERQVNFLGARMPSHEAFHFMMKSLLGWVKTARLGHNIDTLKLVKPRILPPVLLGYPEASAAAAFDWESLPVAGSLGTGDEKRRFLAQSVADCLKESACFFILKTTSGAFGDGYLQGAVDEIAKAIIPKEPTANPLFIMLCDIRKDGGEIVLKNLDAFFDKNLPNLHSLPRFTALDPADIGEWAGALKEAPKMAELTVVKNLNAQKYRALDPAGFVPEALKDLGHDDMGDIFEFNAHSIFE